MLQNILLAIGVLGAILFLGGLATNYYPARLAGDTIISLLIIIIFQKDPEPKTWRRILVFTLYSIVVLTFAEFLTIVSDTAYLLWVLGICSIADIIRIIIRKLDFVLKGTKT